MKARATTAIAILCLALGIGANTTIIAVIALAAGAISAIRAARIDPLGAMRAE